MNLSADNLLRIGLAVGGLLLGAGSTLGTQWATAPEVPKKRLAIPVEADVGCLEIHIPLNKVKVDRVKGEIK